MIVLSATWAELEGGDDQVVRATGLDITVSASDGQRRPGHLSRQGPQRCCAGRCLRRPRRPPPSSPDDAYYTQVKARQGNRATLAVARKLARRVRHTLVRLGDIALAPIEDLPVADVA
jgi:transposase